MEQPGFYYSSDGTDAHGPVGEEQLRQLCRSGSITPRGFWCRVGETQWQPFPPESFQVPPPHPGPPPPPPPTIAPTVTSVRPDPFAPRPGNSIAVTAVNIGAGFVGLGAAILLTVVMAYRSTVTQSPPYYVGSVCGALMVFCAVPCLIALFFKGLVRAIVRLAGIAFVSSLSLLGLFSAKSRILAQERAFTTETRAEAKKEIAAKGYYSGDASKAQQNMDAIAAQATDNSPTSRLTRGMLVAERAFLDKVKASQDQEKTCKFDPTTITDVPDIDARKASIQKLHALQGDVVQYLQEFDSHCRDALASDNLDPTLVNQTIAGARKGAHIELMIELWKVNLKLSDDHVARLDFLEKNWGLWNVKEGKMLFEEKESATTYNTLMGNLQDDVKQLGAIQKQIFQ